MLVEDYKCSNGGDGERKQWKSGGGGGGSGRKQ